MLVWTLLHLAACTVVGAFLPLEEWPRDPPLAPTLTFNMSDGATLPVRAWLPEAGQRWRGVILGLHGFTDSRDGWELAAPVFAAAGYALYAPDQRGFGATATRGTWPGTARLVQDADELVAQLRAAHPGLPVIVMGESMGGAVALVLAARPQRTADAFVLLAPALWGWGQLDAPLAATLQAANLVAPGWTPNPGRAAENIFPSDDRAALVRMARDPLTLRLVKVSATAGLVDLMTAAQAACPRVHGRVLILSGRRDLLVPPRATAAAWARLPASVRRAFYPHGYHLLLRDTDRALVDTDILAWLAKPDAWLPSGADAAAAAWQSDHAWQGTPSAWLPAAGERIGGAPVWPY